MEQYAFSHSKYLLRKQFFKVFGGSFRVYDPSGSLAFFASLKAFKLREDITVYADEGATRELFRIKARSIIDFSAAYDVFDVATNQLIGTLKRRGLKSMLKDEWIMMDSVGNEFGTIREDSLLLAMIRRFLTNLIPQKFEGEVKGFPAFQFRQHFNPFVQKMDLDFSLDQTNVLDRRLGIAAAILICAIEGRQQ